ncbi:MAG: hypothetical protein GEV09_11515 [Pseudonocardiaceae bacterium]|nr:hypothetical protein [Pseudonocardiaceae bacterium]
MTAPAPHQPHPVTPWRAVALVLGGSLVLSATSLTVVLLPQLFGALHREWRTYLDVLGEANLPTWWSSALLVTAALAHGLTGAAGRLARAPGAAGWFVSAGVLTALSVDDHTQLHERSGRIGRALVTYDSFPFYWLLPGVVGGLAVAAALVLLALRVQGATRWLLVTGTAVLLGCALGLELVQGMLMADGHEATAFTLTYHVEELGENIGALLLLAAAATAVSVTRHGSELDVHYTAHRSYL